MAIGDYSNSNNGNGNKIFENTYYSRLRLKSNSTKLNLGFSFRSGLLILTLSSLNEGKYENCIDIYLSPTKAKLLVQQIKEFKKYLSEGMIDPNKGFGVNAGMGEKVSYIALHSDESKHIFITIGKFDNDGKIIEHYTTELNQEYNFALQWSDVQNNKVSKVYDNMIELNQLEDLCEDFSRYMNGALAYSVADLTKYDLNRVVKKMDPIYDKLGIERLSGNKNYNNDRGNNNFLNNSNSTSNHQDYDDIESMFNE